MLQVMMMTSSVCVCMCVVCVFTQQCQLLDVGADFGNQNSGILLHPSLVGHDGEL